MHYRSVDAHGVVHYADKIWRREVADHVFTPWCAMGREKKQPSLDLCMPAPAKPRNQAVTCLVCLHLRTGARSG